MLVILSDLHLNDGTTGATLSPGAVTLLSERLQELALVASWRADGAYRPIERIDLVLLGDTLDLLHSARWQTSADVRPWSDPRQPRFADMVSCITSDILTSNQEAIGGLRALSADGAIAVPPMLRAARPASDKDRQPVLIRMHYMVGDHDWFYHLPGEAFNALRGRLIEQLGLANRTDQPFAHDITESDELLQTMRRHKLSARHGDIYDPLAFEGDRDSSSLSDMITVELVGRFMIELERTASDILPDAAVLGLREIDQVRPLLLVPAWIEGLLERTCPQPALRKRIKGLWDRLTDDLLAHPLVRQRDASTSLRLLDGLSRALRFSKRSSAGWTAVTLAWLDEIRGATCGSYAAHALAEPDFRNRRARHVVFGHTHEAEIVPLDASHAEGYVLEQTYFNAGTWRRVYRQAQFAPQEHEFLAAETIGFLAFYQGDERKGRAFETWHGTLGCCPAERIVHRIDPGRAYRGMGPHALDVPGTGAHSPHFLAQSARPHGTQARRQP